jgi:hypothetical protein
MAKGGLTAVEGGLQYVMLAPHGVGVEAMKQRAANSARHGITATIVPVHRLFRRPLVIVTLKNSTLAQLSNELSRAKRPAPSYDDSVLSAIVDATITSAETRAWVKRQLPRYRVFAAWICGYGDSRPPSVPRS